MTYLKLRTTKTLISRMLHRDNGFDNQAINLNNSLRDEKLIECGCLGSKKL